MKRLRILTLCSVLLAAGIFYVKRQACTFAAGEGLVINKGWLKENPNPVTPKQYCRPADQTFLTFPEWFLVFSPEEQAQYFKTHTASSFPFMSHTAQIWESYGIVNEQIKGNFPYNGGYHFMIWVIGTSASVEYSIKAWYETVVGRVTDTHESICDEDKLNARFTQNYVDFIKDLPWYEFDFKKPLAELWEETPVFGDHFLRKIERRYILTSELLVKMAYGKLIGLGTKTVYEEAALSTEVLVDSCNTDFKVVQRMPGGQMLLSLPRYDRFYGAVSRLAAKGCHIKEIVGNTSAILMTVLVPTGTKLNFDNTQPVFTQPISSGPGTERVALAVQVKDLESLLLSLEAKGLKVEHVFDY